MIAFIIPLKSKTVSKNWDVTSKLLSNTLASIYNQSCQEFTICIVGHEKPNNLNLDNDKVGFYKSPFPLKLKDGRVQINSYLDIDRIMDKLQKIHIGLVESAKYSPVYYMVLDADDFLHRDFVHYVVKNQNPNGYLVKKGYEYYPFYKKLIERTSLEKICGSTTVIHKRHVVIPDVLNELSFGPIIWNKLSHSDMEEYFDNIKCPLQTIPFPSLLYTLDHGQNASDEFRKSYKSEIRKQIKMFLFGRKISRKVKMDFSLC